MILTMSSCSSPQLLLLHPADFPSLPTPQISPCLLSLSQLPLLLTWLSDLPQWHDVAMVTEAIKEAVFMLSHTGARSSALTNTHDCTYDCQYNH